MTNLVNRILRSMGGGKTWGFETPRFVWYDLWVGVYISKGDNGVNEYYFCPIPCVVFLLWTYSGDDFLPEGSERG